MSYENSCLDMPDKDIQIGGADSEQTLQIKLKMIAAFDEILYEPLPEKLNELWKEIDYCEKTLYKQLKKRI